MEQFDSLAPKEAAEWQGELTEDVSGSAVA